MAKLHYSSSLTLNLWVAAERQRNGEPHVIGASIPVTKRFYDEVFRKLSEDKNLVGALKKITTKKIEKLWQEIFDSKFDGVYIPKGNIKVTPCIQIITPKAILVGIPFYIEGATSLQIERILKECLQGCNVLCVGNEIRVELEPFSSGSYDLTT